jgi:hypothetical protein
MMTREKYGKLVAKTGGRTLEFETPYRRMIKEIIRNAVPRKDPG